MQGHRGLSLLLVPRPGSKWVLVVTGTIIDKHRLSSAVATSEIMRPC